MNHFFLGLIISLFCSLSVSQEKKQSEQEVNKKSRTQVISFEDQLVEGSSKSPDLFYLLQKKNFRYRRLIKLRENFLPEIAAAAEDLEESSADSLGSSEESVESGEDVGE